MPANCANGQQCRLIVALDGCVQTQANIGTKYAHVQAGRAHDSLGYALANGSNQNIGLDSVFYQTTLKKTGANSYVIGCP